MNSFRKFRVADAIKWVPFFCAESNFRTPKSDLYVNGSSLVQFVRFLATESALSSHNDVNLCELAKRSRVAKDEAQAVLLDYFHSSSGLQFSDAENMSKNSPMFFHSLTNMVVTDEDKVTRSLSRFLRYNPINEFEPFFESIGLKPSEYLCYLPRNLLFLNDDPLLLENYYFFCNYGVARNRIGKIYKEATEVFRLEPGALGLKLRSFEKLGLNQSLISKIIASSPHLLKGNIEEFVEVLERLKKLGIEYEWLGDHISADDSYNWKCLLELMCFLSDLGLSQDLQRELFIQHPTLLLEQSGRITFCLLGFFLKFGSTLDDVENAFLGLPKMPVLKFAYNLHNSYQFLIEIGMAVEDIGKLVRLHPTILGSCEIRTVRSLGYLLSCGKNELCQMLKDDPLVFNNWAVEELEEKKCVERSRKTRDEKLKVKKSVEIVRARKTKFLMSLGFEENSKAMQKALNVFRGNGAAELQERFDCLLNMGLNREDLIGMVKLSPQILNQPKAAIEKKIGVFVEELGYPVTDLLAHPRLVSYTMERVKRRLLMYKWLREERVVHPKLALSTLLSCSEEVFVKNQVKSHPQGPQMYETLKIEINASGSKCLFCTYFSSHFH